MTFGFEAFYIFCLLFNIHFYSNEFNSSGKMDYCITRSFRWNVDDDGEEELAEKTSYFGVVWSNYEQQKKKPTTNWSNIHSLAIILLQWN